MSRVSVMPPNAMAPRKPSLTNMFSATLKSFCQRAIGARRMHQGHGHTHVVVAGNGVAQGDDILDRNTQIDDAPARRRVEHQGVIARVIDHRLQRPRIEGAFQHHPARRALIEAVHDRFLLIHRRHIGACGEELGGEGGLAGPYLAGSLEGEMASNDEPSQARLYL